MLPITQLVDIPYLFKRLHDLPDQLADVRSQLWQVKMGLKQGQTELAAYEAATLDQHKEEYFALKNEAQRDLYKANLYREDTELADYQRRIDDCEVGILKRTAQLDSLLDELTGLRYTVRLLETVTVTNQQDISEMALEILRSHAILPRVAVDAEGCQAVLHTQVCVCPEGPCPGPKPCDHEGAARPCVPGEQDDEADELPF
jgi:hypothetical protein